MVDLWTFMDIHVKNKNYSWTFMANSWTFMLKIKTIHGHSWSIHGHSC